MIFYNNSKTGFIEASKLHKTTISEILDISESIPKNPGKGCAVFYTEDLESAFREALSEDPLLKKISTNELSKLVFQTKGKTGAQLKISRILLLF